MDMQLPLILCISFLLRLSRSVSSNMMLPSILAGGVLRRRIMHKAVILLPQPDSPTIPRVSPFMTSKVMPFKISVVP